eukprot:Tamp_22605.p1 GENE.Tamp_22605~~Tamp_22605.p1  ORF type:complete len:251 (-),score=74.01 Tamp_22605:325-1032(-)
MEAARAAGTRATPSRWAAMAGAGVSAPQPLGGGGSNSNVYANAASSMRRETSGGAVGGIVDDDDDDFWGSAQAIAARDFKEEPKKEEKKEEKKKDVKGSSKTLNKAQASQFSKWCQTELEKLTGSDDTTLAEFLMSLHSASEVMEYAEDYLGSKGRAFAEEFVLRKQMDGVQQVTSKKQSGGGGTGAWGTAGTAANTGASSAAEWENGIPGMAPVGNAKGKKKKKKGDAPVGFLD